jgi:hypothetical protein
MPRATDQLSLGPGWLQKRIRAVEREIQLLRTARRLAAATIGEGGLTVDGGFLKVVDLNGNELFYVGPITPTLTNGTPQRGMILRRNDNSIAAMLHDANPGDGSPAAYRQALTIWDRAGNVVLADDTDGGQGVARPYVPWQWSSAKDDVVTTSAAFVETHSIAGPRQHPKMAVGISAIAGASTAGQVQLVVGGNVVAGPTSIPSGGSVAPTYVFTLPAGVHTDLTYISIQARRSSGAGNITVRPFFAYGVQT